MAWYNSEASAETPEGEKDFWYEELRRLEDLVSSTPSRTLAGVREQIRFALAAGERGDDPGPDEERALRLALDTVSWLAEMGGRT